MLNPDALSGNLSPSEAFGLNKGMQAYYAMLEKCPALRDEATIDYLARRATWVAMVNEAKFDIDVDMASNAIVNAFESEFAFSE